MKVTCWGARGSLPSPSRKGMDGKPDFMTLKYGGNTSCYTVDAGDLHGILDQGSGATVMGDAKMASQQGVGKHFYQLFSHFHWDHVYGAPFCTPFYIASNTFHVHGHEPPGHEGGKQGLVNVVERLLSEQQISPHFPVAHASFPSVRLYHSHSRLFSESWWYFVREDGSYEMVPNQLVGAVKETLPPDIKMDPRRWMKMTTIPLNHPDGCLGYRLDWMGNSVVYATDTEPLRYTNAALNRFAKDCDLLIMDGQYTEQQLATSSQGFGHGTPRACVEQAHQVGAKTLWIQHHDPKHDDAMLDMMELDAQSYAVQIGYQGTVVFAREGMTWEQE